MRVLRDLRNLLWMMPFVLVALLIAGPSWSAPALLGSSTSFVVDDDDDKKKDKKDKKDEESDEDDEDDEDEDEDADEYLAVVGGDIHTGTGSVLRGASLLAKNGKIEEIGYELDIPEEAEVLRVPGYRVYPGLVAFSSSGLLGGGGDFANTVDPFNTNMILGLASGITSTGQSNAVAKLKRFDIEGVLVRKKSFATFSWSNRNPTGKKGLREKFQKARDYLDTYRQWQEDVKKDKKLKEPSKSGVDASVLKVLRGELRAKFRSNDRDELLGISRFCREFEISPVIEGCGEGWAVAGELGRSGAMAVVTPRYRSSKDERLVSDGGSSIENAALLHAAGVPISIVPASRGVSLSGIVGRDIMHLPIEAGFAVRGGLSEDAALRAITIEPARMLGVSQRVGSLEVGKDCDLIVTDGDILHYETFVQYAVVDGKQVYDKEKELYFAHIRPRPESELAPESKLDPGEEVDEEAATQEGTEEDEEDGEGEEEDEEEDEEDDEEKDDEDEEEGDEGDEEGDEGNGDGKD